jgi:hypothetical protein
MACDRYPISIGMRSFYREAFTLLPGDVVPVCNKVTVYCEIHSAPERRVVIRQHG